VTRGNRRGYRGKDFRNLFMVGFECGNVYVLGMPNGLAPALSCALHINVELFQALNVNCLS
jgi:hypothetical protein